MSQIAVMIFGVCNRSEIAMKITTGRVKCKPASNKNGVMSFTDGWFRVSSRSNHVIYNEGMVGLVDG